ncbi:MAG: type II toxin-antitoxin system Phd/YefM family antitoxin [Patescibacteria group bacterium]
MIQQLINDQKFINVQGAQAGLTRLFADADRTGTFYTVLKNDQPLGVLLSKRRWESLTEDLEAMSSSNYKRRIAESRKSPRVSASVIRKLLK